jgi:ATP-dependent exoDNAse (exonuclease V) beta subunit
MAEQQLLDFDDLLHHCLALLSNNPKVCGVGLFVKSVFTSVTL